MTTLKHTMKMRRIASITVLVGFMLAGSPFCSAQEEYGPPNLLKTAPTPFSDGTSAGDGPLEQDLNRLTFSPAIAPVRPRNPLSRRLASTRVYLPSRMVLGRPSEFVVKGRAGKKVAVAMADRNSGSRPVHGHELRLGPDRKVVTLGVIPDTGVLSLFVETPIQGDLVGQHLYFETAVWSRPDFSDLEIAVPVKSEVGEAVEDNVNGVPVCPDVPQKRGFRIVPDAGIQLLQRQSSTGLDSLGRP